MSSSQNVMMLVYLVHQGLNQPSAKVKKEHQDAKELFWTYPFTLYRGLRISMFLLNDGD